MFCPSCDKEIPEQSTFCMGCGKAVQVVAVVTSIPATAVAPVIVHASTGGPAQETKFFDHRGVVVTNARFISGDHTYAMGGITSVKSYRQDPSRTGPILWGIFGLLLMIAGPQLFNNVAIIVGLIILVCAILYLFGLKSEFSVRLTTASGEVKALASRDAAFISRVVSALNDAIVHRG